MANPQTPKKGYEDRKAERRARAEAHPHKESDALSHDLMDLLDRFVTAFERHVEIQLRKG